MAETGGASLPTIQQYHEERKTREGAVMFTVATGGVEGLENPTPKISLAAINTKMDNPNMRLSCKTNKSEEPPARKVTFEMQGWNELRQEKQRSETGCSLATERCDHEKRRQCLVSAPIDSRKSFRHRGTLFQKPSVLQTAFLV